MYLNPGNTQVANIREDCIRCGKESEIVRAYYIGVLVKHGNDVSFLETSHAILLLVGY
jgi:hypothetical protein